MDSKTHPFDREEVMAYLDGELTPERAAATAGHLEQCGECRALAAELRAMTRQMPEWEVEMIPASVQERVLLAAAEQKSAGARVVVEERPEPRRSGVRLLLWGGALGAAALFLLMIGGGALHRSRIASDEAARVGRDQTSALATAATPPPPSTFAPPRARATTAPAQDMNALAKESRAANAPLMNGRAAAAQGAEAKTKDSGPMIVRRASLALLTKEFDAARAGLENLVKAHQGYFGQLAVTTPAGAGRGLTATARVPATQLDAVLVELRKLGHVEQENQTADDVTGQYVDLTARLGNARETEKRLVEILRERTGRVSEVLEVEQQISRTRQQIEQMDAERKTMENQVHYAAVELRITEEYKQSLQTPAPSLGTRINNAAVGGLRDAAELLLGLFLWVLSAGPSLVVTGGLFAWPAWWVVRWARRQLFAAQAAVSR